MAVFNECTRCGNRQANDNIYSCDDCGEPYCSACLPHGHCNNCTPNPGTAFFAYSPSGYIAKDE